MNPYVPESYQLQSVPVAYKEPVTPKWMRFFIQSTLEAHFSTQKLHIYVTYTAGKLPITRPEHGSIPTQTTEMPEITSPA